ncbi:hypothetical protein MC885_016848 [Smutsia gigantea]|nr:hypothetical protein MC885_016848 [Smutsia gigantea]
MGRAGRASLGPEPRPQPWRLGRRGGLGCPGAVPRPALRGRRGGRSATEDAAAASTPSEGAQEGGSVGSEAESTGDGDRRAGGGRQKAAGPRAAAGKGTPRCPPRLVCHPRGLGRQGHGRAPLRRRSRAGGSEALERLLRKPRAGEWARGGTTNVALGAAAQSAEAGGEVHHPQ